MERNVPGWGAVVRTLALLLLPAAAVGADLRPIPEAIARLAPQAIEASVEPDRARRLAGLCADRGTSWPSAEAGAQPAELRVALPRQRPDGGWLVIADLADPPARGRIELYAEGRGRTGTKPVATAELAGTTARLALPARTPALRLRLVPAGEPVRLERLRLLRLDPEGRNDYWLFVGASLTVGGIRDGVEFGALLARSWPGYRPYVANEAVSGWTSGRLRRELPAILARHPHARYVAIHIGGNDVSLHRPYPGGAQALQANLVAILEQIRAAGKIPVLARLSYRAYRARRGKPPVPPESNGSGPYNEHIYDPLIARYCPAFYDRRRGRGIVDLYEHYRTHPDEIGADGVHLRPQGYASWRRVWAQSAGAVIYGRR